LRAPEERCAQELGHVIWGAVNFVTPVTVGALDPRDGFIGRGLRAIDRGFVRKDRAHCEIATAFGLGVVLGLLFQRRMPVGVEPVFELVKRVAQSVECRPRRFVRRERIAVALNAGERRLEAADAPVEFTVERRGHVVRTVHLAHHASDRCL